MRLKNVFRILSIVLLLGCLLSPVYLIAQSILFDVKVELNKGKLKYNFVENGTFDSNSKSDNRLDFSFGISANLNDKFRLKTNFGTNDVENRTQLNWNVDGTNYNFLSRLRVKQNFLEILAEHHWNKFIYLSGGLGINKIRDVEHVGGGSVYINDQPLPKVEYAEFSNGVYPFLSLNFGFNCIPNNIGVMLETGIRISGTSKHDVPMPGLGANQLHLKCGVVYRIGN